MKSLLHLGTLLILTATLGLAAVPAEGLAPVKTSPAPIDAASQATIATVKARLVESFVATADGASEVSVPVLLATLDAAGHWPDLDVKYPPDTQGAVSRYVHFMRVWKLSGAWHQTTDAPRRAELSTAIHRAVGFWLHAPIPPGIPWFYLIAAPQAVARAALILEDELNPEERRAAIAIMQTCVRADGVLIYAGSPATGQNLQHEAEIQIVAGCLMPDPAYLARHATLIEREVAIRDAEGLKADWSFHQHGPQLYSGAFYGAGFARDGAKLAWALRDTPFAFSPASVDALVHCVLDGQQWMARGRSFDFLTAGRGLVWPRYQAIEPEGDRGVADAAAHLAELDPAGRDELLALSARLSGQAAPSTAPSGNRVFWASDYQSHQRPGFFASARMSSRRMHGTESGSGQNALGYHLGDGAMALMVTGEEYRDIFPLWDWRRVPGVTAVDNPSVPFPIHTWGKGSQGWSDFAGGVSDGSVGAAAMELRRGGLHAKKAWFFLDDVVVCLGADIQPDDPALPVVTSIDQRWADGPVSSSASAAALPSGDTHPLTGPGWVHHAGVTYLFPSGGEVRVRTEHKSAPWSSINKAVHGSMFRTQPLTERIATGEVFSLWIDHGANVHFPVGYAYLVAPGLAPEAIAAFNQIDAPRILANTDALQAIARADLVQVVFWQAGSLTLPDGRSLSVDRPGVVQLRRDPATRQWTLAVGNPTHQPGPFRVRHTASPTSPATEINFDFPAGLYAGQPQLKPLPEASSPPAITPNPGAPPPRN